MKKYVAVCLLLLFACVCPVEAVLKEKNLAQTLSVLRAELEVVKKTQVENSQQFVGAQKRMRQRMLAIMEASDQTSLMLYSQQPDYVFDLTYACHEATEQYSNFNNRLLPFSEWVARINLQLKNYERLISSLRQMPPFVLTDASRVDRDACLELATQIRDKMLDNRGKIQELSEQHNRVGRRLKQLNDYAKERYSAIRQNIFVNGGDNYFEILSTFSRSLKQANSSLVSKYKPSGKARSEWRGPIVVMLFVFVLFYLFISSALSFVFIRWLLPARFKDEKFAQRRTPLVMTFSIVTFAVVLMILRAFVLSHNFVLMASELLIEYAWLLAVVLVSLLVRMRQDPSKIKSGFRIYSPIFLLGFVVIVFRIIFIPNELVNVIFPPILLACSIWQYTVIRRHNDNISKWDIFYTWVSLAVVVFSTVVAWGGYTLLAVQVLIWWYMQLTCIQSITCIYELLFIYERRKIADPNDISQTYFYDFIYKAIVPIMGTISVMLSIYWAAMVFDLTELCKYIFTHNYISFPGMVTISITKLTTVIALFFLVRYFVYAGKAFYQKAHLARHGQKSVVALGMNVVSIITWGIYVIIAMKILGISNSGVVVAIGGMSTGLGFAMKDTIENLFYGISLMTGRVRVGDVIELDGVRGKVSNINYQATMVETIDGSVMAFLNSQLFTKNFKNLTKNHGYEIVKVPVGVAYGTDVKMAREVILERIASMDCYSKKKGLQILFDNFGDNSVDLILVAWVPVTSKMQAVSQMKEAIYEVFNSHHIEIPFPQRDIYVRQMPTDFK